MQSLTNLSIFKKSAEINIETTFFNSKLGLGLLVCKVSEKESSHFKILIVQLFLVFVNIH